MLQRGVPVIRRFSGGGTVVVDGGTVFATLIMQARGTAAGMWSLLGGLAQLAGPHTGRTCCSLRGADAMVLGQHKPTAP